MHALARFSVVLIVVLAAGSLLAGKSNSKIFEPDTFTLDNGMQVVVVENHRMPAVTQMVWYRVGAMDEPPGLSGMAHLLEHLMFKGTETVADEEFSATIAALGGRENAFTSADFTAYIQTIAVEYLETVMRLEADRMTNLTLEENQVITEKRVVLEERNQRIDNNPATQLSEQVDAMLFLNHPYRRPIIGWAHEIAGLERDDILRFYRNWYTPRNAILVVAGDVTVDTVRPLAEKYYGVIPNPTDETGAELSIDEPVVLREPPHLAPRRVSLMDERVGQPTLSRSYLAPSYSTSEQSTVDALDVGVAVLGGTSTSLLYRRLVVEDELAVSAGAAYNPSVRGPASVTVYASPRPGVTLDELEAAIDAIIASVIRGQVDLSDVDRVKRRLRAEAVYARDNLSSGAYILGQALAIGRSIEDVETWPDRIAAVKLIDVSYELSRLFDNRRSVTAWLQPIEPPTTVGATPMPTDNVTQ